MIKAKTPLDIPFLDGDNASYDEIAKRFLAHKSLLAQILKELVEEFKEALINSARHLGASFSPCHCQRILRIALAMRPVRFLGRTKILHQSDRLHFISASLRTALFMILPRNTSRESLPSTSGKFPSTKI